MWTYLRGGGLGVRDNGKLATSRGPDKLRMDPNVWAGLKVAPGAARALEIKFVISICLKNNYW